MMRIWKVNPVNTSISSISSQFVQKCFKSGTAKGKGKIKEGLKLKRSKITVKKGGAATAESSKGGHGKSEFEVMVDNCLNATAPVRFLKPKEKAREAEREKMGLISEARKKEIEQFKKDSKQKKENDKDNVVMGTPGLDWISLGLVDADKIPKYELTVEDGRRLAKEYSRVLMRKHRARQAAETNFLKCKNEATDALPEKLKIAALVPDYTPFPVNRFMATLTPPIEGYVDSVNDAAKRAGGVKEKLR